MQRITKLKINNFFSSGYVTIIYAILLFCGFLSNQTTLMISLASIVCGLSLIFSNSINGLFSFLIMLPLGIKIDLVWDKPSIIAFIFAGVLILSCLVAHIVENRQTIKSNFKFGRLIWGLMFAFVVMFIAGVGNTSYVQNGFYIAAFLYILVTYVLAVNTRDDAIAKTLIAFALLLNFEKSITGFGDTIVFSNALIINAIAVCLCFKLAKNDLPNTFYYGFIAVIFLVFSVVYSASIIVVGATFASFMISLIYFVIKEKKKSFAIIPSLVVGAVVIVVALHLTNYTVIRDLQDMVKNFSFVSNNILLENLSNHINFGIGFESFEASNIIYFVASLGAVGSTFVLLLFLQITKTTFIRTTYNRVFVIIGYLVLIVTSVFGSFYSPVLIACLISFFAINETEIMKNAENPWFNEQKWEEKKVKYAKIEENEPTFYQIFAKRAIDIILSFAGIVVLSPLFMVICILSLIFLKGNPFFAQYRPGKNGKVFKLYKFRSMTNKKDANGNLLPDKDRITKYGKIIRKLSIDELPQLFNILIGDMSIVGPRPRLVKDMIFYDEDVMQAYSVRPGLTGRSQVSGGRSESSWESIFEEDLKYYKKITLWGDIKILLLTVKAVLSPSSANGGAETSKREYYYADYLLKTGKISQDQYNKGLELSKKIIDEKATVKYSNDLHN